MDAADFIVAGQGAPTFEVSDQAVLHMEDTTAAADHRRDPPAWTGCAGVSGAVHVADGLVTRFGCSIG